MVNSFNFNELPTKTSGISEGYAKLTIIEAKEVIAKTGAHMLQLTYMVNDSKFKINFDNIVLTDKNQEPSNFGLVKLRKLLEALELDSIGEFTVKILIKKYLIGKSFYAYIEKNKDNDFYNIGNIDKFLSVVNYNKLMQNTITPADLAPSNKTASPTKQPETTEDLSNDDDFIVDEFQIETEDDSEI